MNRYVQIWSKPKTKPPSAAVPTAAMPPTAPMRRAELRENVSRAPQERQWNPPGPTGTRHLGYAARQRGQVSVFILSSV